MLSFQANTSPFGIGGSLTLSSRDKSAVSLPPRLLQQMTVNSVTPHLTAASSSRFLRGQEGLAGRLLASSMATWTSLSCNCSRTPSYCIALRRESSTSLERSSKACVIRLWRLIKINFGQLIGTAGRLGNLVLLFSSSANSRDKIFTIRKLRLTVLISAWRSSRNDLLQGQLGTTHLKSLWVYGMS